MGTVFEMELWEKPFIQVSSGKKTIELRLYDFKRRCLNVSDYIIFSKMFFGEPKIAVKIIALHIYPSFEDLFKEFPVSDCGFEGGTTVETALEEMKQYYSVDDIKRYGIVGIRIKLVDLQEVLDIKEQNEETEYDRLFPDGMK